MHLWLMDILACPACRGDLQLVDPIYSGAEVEQGLILCPSCQKSWEIRAGIPRFVEKSQDYASNFAFEWQRWGDVQIDRLAGHKLSLTRFLEDSRWDREWIKDKLIMDAGCGAGRFSDAALSLGARVVSVDLSEAADVCRHNNSFYGDKNAVVQASFYALPFKPETFDGLFCMGVIQHTPEPEKTMRILPQYLKSGGLLAYNFYEKGWYCHLQFIKYSLRFFTRHLPHGFNLRLSHFLTFLFFPLTYGLSHIPKLRIINFIMPICLSNIPGLTLRQKYIWTLLDTFDWYSPRYEIRQDHRRVALLLQSMGLKEVASASGLAWGKAL